MKQRTQSEILARIQERKPEDIFGWECGHYIDYLKYVHARSYLKEGVTQAAWDTPR